MLKLADYDVDPARGFLPSEDPLTELPPAFAEWDRLGRELPYLVLTGRVRTQYFSRFRDARSEFASDHA